MLEELLSGKHKFGDILMRLLGLVSKRRSVQHVVIVLDALDEISRRIQESADLVDNGEFIDGAQHLMLHLVKPIVNKRIEGLAISVVFSCLQPIKPDVRSFARPFTYVDCEKSALTATDKDAILESWKLFWIQRNALYEGCDASSKWLSQVVRLISHRCFQHGDLRVSMLLLEFVLQEAFSLATTGGAASRDSLLVSSEVDHLQLTLDLICSHDMSVQIVSYIAQSLLCCLLKDFDAWSAAVSKSMDALALVAYSGQQSQSLVDALRLRSLFPKTHDCQVEDHLRSTMRSMLHVQPDETSKIKKIRINFNGVLLDVIRRHFKASDALPINAYKEKLKRNEARLSQDQQRRIQSEAFGQACCMIGSRETLISRAQSVLCAQGDHPDQCSKIAEDLMHVLECALAFQSPCCAVDSLAPMMRLVQDGHAPSFEVLGELSSLMSTAVLQAAVPSDFQCMRLHGVHAASQRLVEIFSEKIFCYGWTLRYKPGHKRHLVDVLVLLQVLNETETMDRIMNDSYEQIFFSGRSRVILWNQVMKATMKCSITTKKIEQMISRMESQGIEPDVVTWSTLMNAHAVKGDAAACERVMRDMQKAGQEPNVTTWSTLMNAHQKARSGFDVLRTFNEMHARRVMHNSHSLSTLFNGLMFGINGDRRAGALKVIELYPSLVTPANLSHFVATPILRALADTASAADVDRFWCFCEQHLQACRQGWPGNANAKVLFDFCSRAGNRGAWARVAALLSGAGAEAGAGGAAAAGGGARAESSRAGGGTDPGGNSAISRAFCKNWNEKGCCPFGDRCRYKDGHR